MAVPRLIAGCAVALGVLSLSACHSGLTTAAARPPRGSIGRQLARAPVETPPPTAPTQPPPMHAELVPPPPAGGGPTVWHPGHWDYTDATGDPWAWRHGRYVPVPQGKTTWIPGWWSHKPNGSWTWVRGHWA